MAINNTEDFNQNNSGATAQPQTNEGTHSGQNGQGTYSQPSQGDAYFGSLSFGSRDIFTMQANQGSEYTLGLAKTIMESYKILPTSVRPKVSVLDKEVIENLAYSAIVVSNETESTINYFIMLLEATGRKPMKAHEIVNEIENSKKIQGARPMIYTTDDAIDNILHNEIHVALAKEYGENKHAQSVDGLVVHTHHGDIEVLASKLATFPHT